jgi:parvulin-like peptidyl-prolyl isomerase
VLKRLVAVGAALAFAVLLLTGCGGDLPSGTVAKVGDATITQEQFDVKMKEIVAQLKEQAPDKAADPAGYKLLEQKVLDYMVTLKIAEAKAQSLKVTVTDKDVQDQVDQAKAMFGGDQAKFDAALKQENITLEQLKASYRERSLLTKVAEAVTADVTIADSELQKYYDANKAEFKVDEARTARHILFAPGAPATADATAPATYTDAQWADALAKAEKARQEIINGADFATVAKAQSSDTGTKDQGGDLGVIQKGTMVPEFETSVFGLKKGDISQPIKTQYGYHLIQVTEITPAKQQTFAEVKEQIKTQLLDPKKSAAWDVWLAKMKTEMKVILKGGMELTTTTTAAPSSATTAAGGESTETTAPAAATTTTTTAP